MTPQERLAAAEAELAAIKKQIEDERVGSLLLDDWRLGKCYCIYVPNHDYMYAISTMLELRQQPGNAP